MSNKQLASPFSTGGGGDHFEARVQASFVVLMLTGASAPCLPNRPISKIKLQGRYAGYDTDDMIVFSGGPGAGRERKLLAQIKHSIKITKSDRVFGEVIAAAWRDFNNSELFTRKKDALALITGPLSATDTADVRTLLEWARHCENAAEFVQKVQQAKFSSDQKRAKLDVFRTRLASVSEGVPINDDILWEFLKHYYLLGYDLDIRSGTTLSLLQALIGFHSPSDVSSLWRQIIDEVESANHSAGTISLVSLPDDLVVAFSHREDILMPAGLSVASSHLVEHRWNQHPYASDLAIANLLGSWNERNEADRETIAMLSGRGFDAWILSIRDTLHDASSPVALQNGIWRVTQREELWQALGSRLYDSHLDEFAKRVVATFTERDPQFELPRDERYLAPIQGNTLKQSPQLRSGLAESLALLGNRFESLTHCSRGKPQHIASLVVHRTFTDADWILWASLNSLLPTLAEAAPDAFLSAVERALKQEPSPFVHIFHEEDSGLLAGNNYLTGLLWALESLAWEEALFVRVCLVLGELALHDPGGNWANRPSTSLTTILLPWLPQTTASLAKRTTAVQVLMNEIPSVAWDLLVGLLPNQQQTSSPIHRPTWRNSAAEEWQEKEVTHKEYWEQVSIYTEMAVSMAVEDPARLSELVSHLGSLPRDSFDRVTRHLSTTVVSGYTEAERLQIWNSLVEFISFNKRYAIAEGRTADLATLTQIAEDLAPSSPLDLYRRLFSDRDFDFVDETESWEDQRKKIEDRRRQAIEAVWSGGAVEAILEFVGKVELPQAVGHALSSVVSTEVDSMVLPGLLEDDSWQLVQFLRGYILARQQQHGWAWVDAVARDDWSSAQLSQFFSYLPFTPETWSRVGAWLKEAEGEYWSRVDANPYGAKHDLQFAIDKLVKYQRPRAALRCLHGMRQEGIPLNTSQAAEVLLAAVSSTESATPQMQYRVVEIIKALQSDTTTDASDLFRVEWAYLPLLDGHRGASPVFLESRLASTPSFFCEVIRLVYRSRQESRSEKGPNEDVKAVATNAWSLLRKWEMPPGVQSDGTFSGLQFAEWLDSVKRECGATGHLEVALTHIGQVLTHCPPDPEGLWIDRAAAEALNAKDADEMRNGFRSGLLNLRGVHRVDPSGKPERELADQYRRKAEEVENAGYPRLAVALRGLARDYDGYAERIIEEHNQEE